MDACATFGNRRVLFSKKQINNMRAIFGSYFILFSNFLTHHLYISSWRCTVSSPICVWYL